MKQNYMNDEERNRDIDEMIKLLEKAREDENYLFEVEGWLKGTLKARESERKAYYKELKKLVKKCREYNQ